MKPCTLVTLTLFVSLSAFAEQVRLARPDELHSHCFEVEEVACADISQDGCLEGKTLTYKDRGQACEQVRGEGSRLDLRRFLEEALRHPNLMRILGAEDALRLHMELFDLEPSRIQLRPELRLPSVDEEALRYLQERLHLRSKELPLPSMELE